MKERRDPLVKTHFLESNREKWLVIFILLAGGILMADILSGIDPTVYMQFLMAAASLFLFGASADSALKIYGVKSIRETQVREETKRMQQNAEQSSDFDDKKVTEMQEKYKDDPSYAPVEWAEEQYDGKDFRDED